jgi:hypothetical protein
MKRNKKNEKRCPFKNTPECFDWEPLQATPESVLMSPEQIAEAGIQPNQRLFRCSECGSIWYESHNFAHLVGKELIPEGTFVLAASKTITAYLG